MFIKHRKREHLQIIRTKDTDSSTTTGLEDILFVPKSLPELNFNEIDTSVHFLGKKLDAPILISSMTGGTEEAYKINAMLSRAAAKYNIAISVGSQKAMINMPELSYTYEVRKFAPKVLLIGNIGIDYLLSKNFNLKKLQKALKLIKADALFIHINPLQELAQPEGAQNFRGALKKISEVKESISIPILVKEVGDGIDPATIKKLASINIAAIDIAGAGGTSWSAVEGFRGSAIGELFRNWGLPTAVSLIAAKRVCKNTPLIASGGIKNGQDIAKSIALGADVVGIAKPLILAAFHSEKQLNNEIEKMILELKTTMLLTGVKNIRELKKAKILIKPELLSIVDQLK